MPQHTIFDIDVEKEFVKKYKMKLRGVNLLLLKVQFSKSDGTNFESTNLANARLYDANNIPMCLYKNHVIINNQSS